MKEVLSAIQSAKKSLGAPQLAQSVERAAILRTLSQRVLEKKESLYTAFGSQDHLSEKEFNQYILEPIQAYAFHLDQDLQAQADHIDRHWRPTGLLSFLLPQQLGFRVLMEKLFEVIASGNSAVFKLPMALSDSADTLNDCFLSLLNESYGEGRISFLKSSDFSRQLLVTHPSINGVWLAGRADSQSAVQQSAGPLFLQKKWSFHGPASNTALILSGADLPKVCEQLIHSCFLAAGQWPWSIKKIITLDSDFKMFQELFVKELEKHSESKSLSLFSKDAVRQAKFRLQLMKQEEGFVLYDGEKPSEAQLNPTVFRDLPHCSEAQQEELRFPVALLSSVKYAHEMIRWTNLGGLINGVQVFGPEDKAMSLAKKMETRRVWVNCWIESDLKLLPGLKQSQWGSSDLTWQSEFFGEIREFTVKI
jgi:aminomuconate-semialdehyde/2-hydroxymuconate-6-semialdehyde dehydrogenase